MKATFSVALALTTLAAFGGQACAADDPFEGYQRAFYGKRAQDKAVAAPVTAKAAFVPPTGGTQVLTEIGLQAWEQDHGPANAVISGGVASAKDAHEGYRRGFAGRS